MEKALSNLALKTEVPVTKDSEPPEKTQSAAAGTSRALVGISQSLVERVRLPPPPPHRSLALPQTYQQSDGVVESLSMTNKIERDDEGFFVFLKDCEMLTAIIGPFQIRAKEAQKLQAAMTRSPQQEERMLMMSRLAELARILRNVFVAEKKPALVMEAACNHMTSSYRSALSSGTCMALWLHVILAFLMSARPPKN